MCCVKIHHKSSTTQRGIYELTSSRALCTMSLRSGNCPCFSSTLPILLYILTSWFITWALTSGSSLSKSLPNKISLKTVGVKELDGTQRCDNLIGIFHGKQGVGLILVLCTSYWTRHWTVNGYADNRTNHVWLQRKNNLWYHKICTKLFTLKNTIP